MSTTQTEPVGHEHEWRLLPPLAWWDAKCRLQCDSCVTRVALEPEEYKAFVLAGGVVQRTEVWLQP